MKFAESVGLEVDELAQSWNDEDEFLGLICEKCGSLSATAPLARTINHTASRTSGSMLLTQFGLLQVQHQS